MTMSKALSSLFVACLIACATPQSAHANTPSHLEVEQHLATLGLLAKPNSTWDQRTRQSACMWRELTGRNITRKPLTTVETEELLNTIALLPAKGMLLGLNVNVTCQSATWIIYDADGNLAVKKVMPVSTGIPKYHPTRSGVFGVQYQNSGWHESTLYPGAMMYRPKYFNGGQALHGSAYDGMVYWYPASHGCVRMLHKDIDTLWKAGFNVGSTVRIYGTWRG